MVSNHFFLGEPKDGWWGNEHGVGTLARFLSTDTNLCPAYGNFMEIVRANDAVQQALAASGRVLVMYYEAMKEDLGREIDRISDFLGIPITAAKRQAMLTNSSFEGMKKVMGDGERGDHIRSNIMRKGQIGDWRNHLNAEAWARFDTVFDQILGGVALAEPLRPYQ